MNGRGHPVGMNLFSFFSCLFFLLLLFSGCGLKTFPKAPSAGDTSPELVDLAKRIEGNRLILSWKASERLESMGYIVYRSRGEKKKTCNGCPFVFTPVSEIPFPRYGEKTDETERVRYEETLEPGYRYAFRVDLKTSEGKLYPVTRTIAFEF